VAHPQVAEAAVVGMPDPLLGERICVFVAPRVAGSPPELADLTIYVIDVAAGDKIPSKGGPGITRSDLLVINKIDLAPYVGASLEVMDRDARKMRGDRPFVFTNLKTGQGLDTVIRFIESCGLLAPTATHAANPS